MKKSVISDLTYEKKIRCFAIWRYTKRLLLLAIWYVIWGTSLFAYAEKTSSIFDMKYLVFAIVILLGSYFLFGINNMLFDNTFSGVIINVKTCENFEWFRGIPNCSALPQSYRIMILKIRADNGSTYTFKFPIKEGYSLLFREGTRISHMCGVPYPIYDGKETMGIGVCCICGKITKHANGGCLVHDFDHDIPVSEKEMLILARELSGSEHKL